MSVLTGKTLVVTGAASGIGKAVAEQASAQGAAVLALDIQAQAGAALAQATGVNYLHCDVSSPDSWQAAAENLSGGLDYLHLNAGIQIASPDAPMADYQFDAMILENYRRMMGVNVDGVVFGLQAMLPKMNDGAAIVVTCSLAGVTPYAVDPLYAMSKHAVTGLVRSMGPTLAERNIRINAICPGGIDTAIIPQAQRSDSAVFMTPDQLGRDVLALMQVEETGLTWAKVREDKPPFVIRAPGDKAGPLSL